MSPHEPGTFADLYDIEQRARTKRAGRPKRTRPRKQFTLYLTQEQEEALADMHHAWRKQFKVDRSDIVGFAIEVLSLLNEKNIGLADFWDFESLKVYYIEQVEKM
jgi:hypothetical protein